MDIPPAGPAVPPDPQGVHEADDSHAGGFASDAGVEPPSLCVTYDLGSLTAAEIRRLTLRALCPAAKSPLRTACLRLLALLLWLTFYGFFVVMWISELRRALTVVGCYVVLGSLWQTSIYFAIAKAKRAEKTLGVLSVELSSSGLTRRHGFAVSTNMWPDVLRIDVTRHDLLFYFGHSAVFWMPRRVFATGESESAFLSAADAWRTWYAHQKASASCEDADSLE